MTAALVLSVLIGAWAIVALIRFVIGPTLPDRILAAHALISALALAICIAGSGGAPAALLPALAMVLGGYVMVFAAAKLIHRRTLQTPLVKAASHD